MEWFQFECVIELPDSLGKLRDGPALNLDFSLQRFDRRLHFQTMNGCPLVIESKKLIRNTTASRASTQRTTLLKGSGRPKYPTNHQHNQKMSPMTTTHTSPFTKADPLICAMNDMPHRISDSEPASMGYAPDAEQVQRHLLCSGMKPSPICGPVTCGGSGSPSPTIPSGCSIWFPPSFGP